MVRSRRAVVTAMLIGLSLAGGGTISVATVGSTMADASNIDQSRFNATVRCRDGTWSWSKHPDAPDACSRHGGVSL